MKITDIKKTVKNTVTKSFLVERVFFNTGISQKGDSYATFSFKVQGSDKGIRCSEKTFVYFCEKNKIDDTEELVNKRILISYQTDEYKNKVAVALAIDPHQNTVSKNTEENEDEETEIDV